MSDMPEKIMAWPDFDDGVTGQWSANTYDDERARPYVLADREAKLVEALRSIAANTCCGTCQEAALVARAALREFDE